MEPKIALSNGKIIFQTFSKIATARHLIFAAQIHYIPPMGFKDIALIITHISYIHITNSRIKNIWLVIDITHIPILLT